MVGLTECTEITFGTWWGRNEADNTSVSLDVLILNAHQKQSFPNVTAMTIDTDNNTHWHFYLTTDTIDINNFPSQHWHFYLFDSSRCCQPQFPNTPKLNRLDVPFSLQLVTEIYPLRHGHHDMSHVPVWRPCKERKVAVLSKSRLG